jgi:methyltransferase (TIGR00027 family)
VSATVKPVSKTAWYCCGVRALDAASPRPVCGDTLAERFMTAEAWALFEPFRAFPMPNVANAVRHRMIDDILRARLAARPDATVLVVGAGFDTRAFRLPAGRWVELDEPALMAFKEERLPARDGPHALTRVPVAFGEESLEVVLRPFAAAAQPVVVLEGVLPYLTEPQVSALARSLRRTLDRPTLVADLMARRFARRYGGPLREQLGALGAHFAGGAREYADLIAAEGFRLERRESVVGRGAELGAVPVPRWLLATVHRGLRDGYAIGTFGAA